MKTISALDLRNNLEGIVKMLRKGERLELTYRGELIAELVPSGSAKPDRLGALKRLHETVSRDPNYTGKTEAYLNELRADQKAWGAPAK